MEEFVGDVRTSDSAMARCIYGDKCFCVVHMRPTSRDAVSWWAAGLGGGRFMVRIPEPVRVERDKYEGAGEKGDPRENPPTSGNVRHDSHMRKSNSDQPIMNAVKYRVVTGVIWTNMTMVRYYTDANRTGVLAVAPTYGHTKPRGIKKFLLGIPLKRLAYLQIFLLEIPLKELAYLQLFLLGIPVKGLAYLQLILLEIPLKGLAPSDQADAGMVPYLQSMARSFFSALSPITSLSTRPCGSLDNCYVVTVVPLPPHAEISSSLARKRCEVRTLNPGLRSLSSLPLSLFSHSFPSNQSAPSAPPADDFIVHRPLLRLLVYLFFSAKHRYSHLLPAFVFEPRSLECTEGALSVSSSILFRSSSSSAKRALIIKSSHINLRYANKRPFNSFLFHLQRVYSNLQIKEEAR
ncbi:hypothetical protein PR048_008294 [Dryococelus australis]|uniref:Uncharacterized protein n=1 Tax=Dryococelus australis TaxID=614101 RepID=A0ABQ9HX12_9NEOP|nr:hypothetical protein PR048_008294 [Dryococelus australis]